MVKGTEYVVLYGDYASKYRTPMFRHACAFIKNCLNTGVAVYAVTKEIR